MENTTELLKWILVALLGPVGWVSNVVYAKINKRKARAEMEGEELKVHIAQYDQKDRELEKAYKTIENQQEVINMERKKGLKVTKESNDKDLLILEAERKCKIAEYNECKIDGCCDRMPPREVELCVKHKKQESRSKMNIEKEAKNETES